MFFTTYERQLIPSFFHHVQQTAGTIIFHYHQIGVYTKMDNFSYTNEQTPPMPKTIRQIKAAARGNLIGNYGKPICAGLLLIIISSIISSLFEPLILYNPGMVQYIIYYAASFIISMLTSFFFCGVTAMHLQIARKKPYNFALLGAPVKQGTNRFLTVAFVMTVLDYIVSIPSSLASTMLYRLRDTPDTAASETDYLIILLLCAITTILAIITLVLTLSISLSVYLLLDDPTLSGAAALKQSISYMKGYKLRLFGLNLSFIGLILLGLLTFGLAYLWILPYMQQSAAIFYESVVSPDKASSTPESI